MKIIIDARMFGRASTGVGRYAQELIENLERIDSSNDYVILLQREAYDTWQPQAANFRKELANYKPYSFSEQILLPLQLYRLKADVVHFVHLSVPYLYFKKRIITIHDLTLIDYKNTHGTSLLVKALYELKYWAMRFIIHSDVLRSVALITPTKFVRSDILRRWPGIPVTKVEVTYEAVDFTHALAKPFPVEGKFLLYVGNAYPYKNLTRLLAAFELMKDFKDLKLVLVGKKDYFYSQLEEQSAQLASTNRLIFTGFTGDEQLAWLYQNAQAVVFPSLAEGFGLPPLEAMAAGVPVISSDASCMPEVLGNAATYFNPHNEHEMAAKITSVLNDPRELARLRKVGPAHVKQFSWRKMAEQTLAVYQRATREPQ